MGPNIEAKYIERYSLVKRLKFMASKIKKYLSSHHPSLCPFWNSCFWFIRVKMGYRTPVSINHRILPPEPEKKKT